ncbi:MAG: bifunctional D-glycero-beta-D-manno-heptose-7-phosphate kinase/D-glycero-beta-D-manno-heptose 1-phosphate adenylyltransferase HldE [Syntrophobacteraceae bacterium]
MADILEGFGGGQVLVIGDVMLDRYVWGNVERISPEAPVQVVRALERSDVLGGAANVAANLAGLKCPVFLLGVCGADSAGETLKSLLAKSGILSELIIDKARRTILKTRIMAHGQQLLRIDEEDTQALSPESIDKALQILKQTIPASRAVIFSDYHKGMLTAADFTRKAIEMASASGIPVLVDPKGSSWDRYRGATCITPNAGEFDSVAGLPGELEPHGFEKRAQAIREMYDLQHLLVTQGAGGMTLFSLGRDPFHIVAKAREVYDVSGAGDTVIATLAAGVAGGLSFSDSARLANTAAGIVVGKVGTQPIQRNELENAVKTGGAEAGMLSLSRVVSLEAALAMVKSWRSSGAAIVFTNGCYDLLHPGHVHLLQQAKDLGQRLIVGLNSDDSVRRLKGPTRPILNEGDRAALLSSLACVDLVVVFNEDTPIALIEALKPEILVKGGDYRPEQVVGKDVVEALGGRVVILPLAQGYSTTGIVEKVVTSSRSHRPRASS